MLVKLRENLFLGDAESIYKIDELKENKITSIIQVADDLSAPDWPVGLDYQARVWNLGLRADRMNPPHIKDLATHTPKYCMQNGEVVLVQSFTGLQRGAYIACRIICELEQKTIYEVMLELKQLVPEFDINKSYF